MAAPNVRESRNPRRRYILSGLLRCPICRRAMSGHAVANGHKRAKVRYYVCRDYCPSCNTVGRVCNKKHYRADYVEDAVLKTVCNMARTPERLESALSAYARRHNNGDRAEQQTRLRHELDTLANQEKATVTAQIAGIQAGAKPQLYAEQFAVIAQKRTALEARLNELGSDTPPEEPQDRAAKIAFVLQQVEEALQTPELEAVERYQILSTIIQTIIPIEEEKYRLYLRGNAETVQPISIGCCG